MDEGTCYFKFPLYFLQNIYIMKKIVCLFVLIVLGVDSISAQNDSMMAESIGRELVECVAQLQERNDLNTDAFLKRTVRTSRKINELTNEYLRITGDSSVICISCMGEVLLASVYNSHGMLDSAYVYAEKVLRMYEPYGRMLCASDATNGLKELWFGNNGVCAVMREWNVKQHNYRDAIEYACIIVDSCEALGAEMEVVKSYLGLSGIYKKMGDYKKAIEYQTRAFEKRISQAEYGDSPQASYIYLNLMNMIEELAEKEKLLVNKEYIMQIGSDSVFISNLNRVVTLIPYDLIEKEEAAGKVFWSKQLLNRYVHFSEMCKNYNAIISNEDSYSSFLVRNFGMESVEYAEYLMDYSDIYDRYVKELDTDIEKEKYVIKAQDKKSKALEIWKNYFEKNPIETLISKYQVIRRVTQKTEELVEEEIRLYNTLSSYTRYLFGIYANSLATGMYDKAYNAIEKSIRIEESVLKKPSDAVSYGMLAQAYILRGNYKDAEKYLNKSYLISYESNDTIEMAKTEHFQSVFYTKALKNETKARQKLFNAYKILKEYSMHSLEKSEVFESMAKFFKSIQNIKMAYSCICLSQIEKKYCGKELTEEDYLTEADYLISKFLVKDSILFNKIYNIANQDVVSEQVQKASELLGLAYASGEVDYADFEKGLFYYQKAADIAHELKDSISEAKYVAEMGTIYFISKDYAKALTYMLKAETINSNFRYNDLLTLMAHIRNDSVVRTRLPLLYSNTMRQLKKSMLEMNSEGRDMMVKLMSYDIFKSMIFYYPDLPVCADVAYNSTLVYKGLLLNTQKFISEYIENSNDLDLKEKYNKLQIMQCFEGQGFSTLEKSLQNQFDIAELEFSILDKLPQNDFSSMLDITWNDIRRKLRKNDVAIEFIEVNKLEPLDRSAIRYGALLLKRNFEHPVFVELGEKEKIDNYIETISNSFNDGNGINNTKWNYLSKQLYDSLWGKLEVYLNEGDNVYFSADGLLHKMPIEILTDRNGHLVNEKYNLYRLSSTRELCKEKREDISKVVLYGGLIYDAENKGVEVDSTEAFVLDKEIKRSGWNYLPATATEIDSISEYLCESNIQFAKISGIEGTEQSFRQLSNSDVSLLHIATHGFYFPISHSDDLNYLQAESSAYIDPMKRSGLMLSGGQQTWLGKKTIAQEFDGVLLSDEIASLDLSQCNTVVLSACQTGLGDINKYSAEGVWGIQRAFKLAGVKTLLMTLWKVDDLATSLMMREFYSNLVSGNSKHDAYVYAQKKVREKYNSPFYWAAFIMLD